MGEFNALPLFFLSSDKSSLQYSKKYVIMYLQDKKERKVSVMGLDLGIVKRRKGEAYSMCSWDDVCWWRNCWQARVIILSSICTYDEDAHEAPINLGAMQKMIEELTKEVSTRNINELIISDDTIKIYQCISDLAKIIHDEMWSWYWGDPEYEYKLIDSY